MSADLDIDHVDVLLNGELVAQLPIETGVVAVDETPRPVRLNVRLVYPGDAE